MVYKLLILIFFLSIKSGYTNIIYDKNEIIITDIEMNNYKNLYKSNFGNSISNNIAIKNIVLMKRTIKFLQLNNPDFISILDKNIVSDYGDNVLNDRNLFNFLRYQRIRNEFIFEYYQNNFSEGDLEIIFNNFVNLKVPLSKDSCLTIEKLHDVSTDKYFIKSFFKNLKNNQQNFTTTINNETYDICIGKDVFKKIEAEIFKFIQNKTVNNFDNFIYGK